MLFHVHRMAMLWHRIIFLPKFGRFSFSFFWWRSRADLVLEFGTRAFASAKSTVGRIMIWACSSWLFWGLRQERYLNFGGFSFFFVIWPQLPFYRSERALHILDPYRVYRFPSQGRVFILFMCSSPYYSAYLILLHFAPSKSKGSNSLHVIPATCINDPAMRPMLLCTISFTLAASYSHLLPKASTPPFLIHAIYPAHCSSFHFFSSTFCIMAKHRNGGLSVLVTDTPTVLLVYSTIYR